MRAIHLVTVGSGDLAAGARDAGSASELLGDLAWSLSRAFGVPCGIAPESLDAAFAYDPVRGQYHSTPILHRLSTSPEPPGDRILGVTSLDLFVPVLTFVFGEAQLEGRCALVSSHRLEEEFYGLPTRPELLRERLFKESVHELGHTFGLRHCLEWDCVMASTHAVERLDLKRAEFCLSCRRLANLPVTHSF